VNESVWHEFGLVSACFQLLIFGGYVLALLWDCEGVCTLMEVLIAHKPLLWNCEGVCILVQGVVAHVQ